MEIVGVVESFDEAFGTGVIRSDAEERLAFHCIEIADGTRTIAVGTPVRATRSVGRRGHDEATAIYTDL